jgi:phenylalanyl-tRNA synthetase beta chain
VLEALARQLDCELGVTEGDEPFLHPGRAATVSVGEEPVGWMGELHPLVRRAWDLDRAAGFEIDLAPLIAGSGHGAEQYEDVISYPAVHQDIAVVVSDDVAAAQVRAAVLGGGGELLRSAEVFDLYYGEQVGEGHKSLALRLEFRAPDRTLTDEEVASRREAIRDALAEIGGTLRE